MFVGVVLFVFVNVFYARSNEWTENNGVIGYFSKTIERKGWTQEYKKVGAKNSDVFYFINGCCTLENTIFQDFDTTGKSPKYLHFEESTSTMKSFGLRTKHSEGLLFLFMKVIPDNFVLTFGCFGVDGCRTKVADSSKPNIHIYNSSINIYSDINQKFYFIIETDSTTRYIMIDGDSFQTLLFDFSYSSQSNLPKYLFTGHNIESVITTHYSIFNVCNRDGNGRYVIYDSIKPLSDCTCSLTTSMPNISVLSNWNYPDCIRNSSMYDLNLPNFETILLEDLKYWNSINFETKTKVIDLNSIGELTIKNLVLSSSNEITFNGNVIVSSLTVTSPSHCIFNDIQINNEIDISSIQSQEIILFTRLINHFDSHFFLNNVKTCGNRFVPQDAFFMCQCIFDGSNYLDSTLKQFIDCFNYKLYPNNNLNLKIDFSSYEIQSNEYWNNVTIEQNTYFNTNDKTLSFKFCSFKGYNILINGSLFCEILQVDSHTRIKVNGKFGIEQFISENDFFNIKSESVISLNEQSSLFFPAMYSVQTCINFAVSSTPFKLINSSFLTYKMISLSSNKLIRICPVRHLDDKVYCTLISGSLSNGSYKEVYCPCYSSNCILQLLPSISFFDIDHFFEGIVHINDSHLVIETNIFDFSLRITANHSFVYFPSQINNTNILFKNSFDSVISSDQPFKLGNEIVYTTQTMVSYCSSYYIMNDKVSCLVCDGIILNGNCVNYEGIDIPYCTKKSKYTCHECSEHHEFINETCSLCPINCRRCINNKCILCEDYYQIDSYGGCQKNEMLKVISNKVMLCPEGFYSDGTQCLHCEEHCIQCTLKKCIICEDNYINNNGVCIKKTNNENIVSVESIISCSNGYFLENGRCILCSSKFHGCSMCSPQECYSCFNSSEIITTDKSCSYVDCISTNNHFISCNDKAKYFNGTDCIYCDKNCKYCTNSKCVECISGYILNSLGQCINKGNVTNCEQYVHGFCVKCTNKMYVSNYECKTCPEHCLDCLNSEYCFKCENGYTAINGSCALSSLVIQNCQFLFSNNEGCAVCMKGYFRSSSLCRKCENNCSLCQTNLQCLECNENYYLSMNGSCLSYELLKNCKSKTSTGCEECNIGYTLRNKECIHCSHVYEGCSECNSYQCISCTDGILKNFQCIPLSQVNHCISVENSICSQCSFWYQPSDDGTYCQRSPVWWVIILVIMVILLVIIITLISIGWCSRKYYRYKIQKQYEKENSFFDIRYCNIVFISLPYNKQIMVNKNTIKFKEENNNDFTELSVGKEIREILCIANITKKTIKVQLTTKEENDRYLLRINPQIITIPKGKGCEFEVFVTPLCSCTVEDQIFITSKSIRTQIEQTCTVKLSFKTKLSTRLDYTEFKEIKKIGEGSFGIVYEGIFRGRRVAIKKIKNLEDNEEVIEEFEKEVSMLDKFRCDYIINFFGACCLKDHICIVTEYAEYGSIRELIVKKKESIPKLSIRLRFLLDAAKGIQYLHNNNILHRDIKPDNILVMSFDEKNNVLTKLTDFGTSRNINMLMTNMTFTKGIGTPIYMAPEVLNQEKYKKEADIYSFAITMYEVGQWNDPFPKSDERFGFPWKIAEFITSGKRLERPITLPENLYNIITHSWTQNPKQRLLISSIINSLKTIINTQ
ncbi:protein serine/threonine kinase, putative [Entamoeba dispar SAW760]|uniref:Protein serine/threonine kinase, putative n=1 Tax=Entamoeba dispar (strain ATCC PRA-260 / SAW760) TaxID=370354 RepID=B0EDM2_ENTDS|nr:protein serine/threonine kinase, putative [Entamoeba dispar SAW760]EDR27385.1 protein serine/threonine kinase, putative [Entamoeba dispar SAW760]|eukprot:EDR27385.1 protein serine/threonine kinase, putative [Entamoeba dispar SAW760]